MGAPETSDPEPTESSVVHHRGLWAKGAFALFVVAPCVFVSVASVRFCVGQGKPFFLAGGVIALCLLILDHAAYYVFCRVAVTSEGLVYRGGGLFWKKVRKRKLLSWSDYIYTVYMLGTRYASLHVHDRKECENRHIDRPSRAGRGEPVPTVSLYPRISAFNEFGTFVGEIRRYNPDVLLEMESPVETDPRK